MVNDRDIHKILQDDGYNLPERLIICDEVFGRPHLYPAVWDEPRLERFMLAHQGVILRMQKLLVDETLSDSEPTSSD